MPHHPKGHSMTKKLEKLPKKRMTKKLEKLPKQKIKKAVKGIAKESIQEGLQEMGKAMIAEKLTKKAGKQILAEKLTKNPIDMKYGKGPHMGHSPAEMGHSPMKKESAKQERKDLMQDNPIAKHASGGSWMSKHSKSAFQMGHSPLEKKVKVNYKGKELTLDDRSQEYKYIMKPKENKQVKTEAVMDRFGTNYTGLKKS